MKKTILKRLTLVVALLFMTATGFSQANANNPLAGVENTDMYNTADLIYMDKDLSVFANLLTLSGLSTSLALTDNMHTVFVPTNEAFDDMSIERYAELTNPKNRMMLVKFINRHITSSKIESRLLTESKAIDPDGLERIKISRAGSTIFVGGAAVIVADVDTSNGLVHVLSDYIKVSDY